MSMPIRRFSASWSLVTWLVTAFCIGIVVIITGTAISQVAKLVPDDEVLRERLSVAVMIVPFALMVSVLFAPLGYTVDEIGIIVNRLGPRVCILHREIAEIRRIKRREVGFTLRVLGSGGFFGSYGRFWSARLGKHRAYVTNNKDLVLITQHDGTRYLLSPFPADGFIAAAEEGRG